MNDFLLFIDDLKSRFAVHVEITYSKTCDWMVYVYKKGCADDYPMSERNENDVVLCKVQHPDMEFAFAKAQVAVKEWLMENNGGY